jgi:hypothetical protein
MAASRSQLIKQCRNRTREKQESRGNGGGQYPVNPGYANRLRLGVEAAKHLGPEVALKFGVFEWAELALEKRSELLVVFVAGSFVGHFLFILSLVFSRIPMRKADPSASGPRGAASRRSG